ncbi:helix-turn-helix domain-containing protein [Paenibacillus dendritiformis]|uniref:helix-turn-helix domain-containing protein n=1 Tax=Paenibacillus dendritiformis TaxID=130049 RepID=UPI00366A143A
MIAETERNITHIAEKVGFGSVNYFSRLFRKYKHMSPAQCRRQARDVTLHS